VGRGAGMIFLFVGIAIIIGVNNHVGIQDEATDAPVETIIEKKN
jgi:hypothetical protein